MTFAHLKSRFSDFEKSIFFEKIQISRQNFKKSKNGAHHQMRLEKLHLWPEFHIPNIYQQKVLSLSKITSFFGFFPTLEAYNSAAP